jgi:thiol-disulfide isomerase/thioredoxin
MEDVKRRRWFTPGRFLDALALLVIAFVVWKIFIAPRALKGADAYPAPRVAFQKLDGGTFRVDDARGRVLFLDFFASWCEPCKIEMPIVEAYARAHPEVSVVPVDVGEPASVVARFAKKHNLHDVALDPTSLSQGFFQIQGFPTIVVVDPDGKIRATWSGLNPAITLAMSNAEKALR